MNRKVLEVTSFKSVYSGYMCWGNMFLDLYLNKTKAQTTQQTISGNCFNCTAFCCMSNRLSFGLIAECWNSVWIKIAEGLRRCRLEDTTVVISQMWLTWLWNHWRSFLTYCTWISVKTIRNSWQWNCK